MEVRAHGGDAMEVAPCAPNNRDNGGKKHRPIYNQNTTRIRQERIANRSVLGQVIILPPSTNVLFAYCLFDCCLFA